MPNFALVLLTLSALWALAGYVVGRPHGRAGRGALLGGLASVIGLIVLVVWNRTAPSNGSV
ncbi:MAG: hypothetical protein AAGA17_08205 [Actinomycetota bacterium]